MYLCFTPLPQWTRGSLNSLTLMHILSIYNNCYGYQILQYSYSDAAERLVLLSTTDTFYTFVNPYINSNMFAFFLFPAFRANKTVHEFWGVPLYVYCLHFTGIHISIEQMYTYICFTS